MTKTYFFLLLPLFFLILIIWFTVNGSNVKEIKEVNIKSFYINDIHEKRALLKTLFLSYQLSSETIFINVAAFRDFLCQDSVREIYSSAKYPKRIFIGVIDQRISGTRVCIPEEYLRLVPKPPKNTTPAPKDQDPDNPAIKKRYLSCYKKNFCPSDNIRIRYVDQTEARGPTYGRFMAGLMFHGETFYLMMDSHSRFYPHFDEFMILDLLRTRDSYLGLTNNSGKGAVLSHYPSGFNRFDAPLDIDTDLMAMCKSVYVPELSVLRNQAMWIKCPMRPLRHPYTAAGFLFSESTAELDVPFDPYLDYVFDGEEILYTVRLYTNGYDAYMPSRAYIFHNYERHHAPRFWSVPKSNWGNLQGITRNRVHYFLQTYKNQTKTLVCDKTCAEKHNLTVSEDKYGLGQVRSLNSFYEMALVNRTGWTIDQNKLCDEMYSKAKKLREIYKY